MHWLSGCRWLGLTVFGCWLPAVWWVGYALLHHRRLDWRTAQTLALATLITAAGALVYHGQWGYALRDSLFWVIPLYLIAATDRSPLEIGLVTWVSLIATDVLFAVGMPAVLPAGWSSLALDMLSPGMSAGRWDSIGGAGLLDGLTLFPVLMMVLAVQIRQVRTTVTRLRWHPSL